VLRVGAVVVEGEGFEAVMGEDDAAFVVGRDTGRLGDRRRDRVFLPAEHPADVLAKIERIARQ
jgi:hypothetical protein